MCWKLGDIFRVENILAGKRQRPNTRETKQENKLN